MCCRRDTKAPAMPGRAAKHSLSATCVYTARARLAQSTFTQLASKEAWGPLPGYKVPPSCPQTSRPSLEPIVTETASLPAPSMSQSVGGARAHPLDVDDGAPGDLVEDGAQTGPQAAESPGHLVNMHWWDTVSYDSLGPRAAASRHAPRLSHSPRPSSARDCGVPACERAWKLFTFFDRLVYACATSSPTGRGQTAPQAKPQRHAHQTGSVVRKRRLGRPLA